MINHAQIIYTYIYTDSAEKVSNSSCENELNAKTRTQLELKLGFIEVKYVLHNFSNWSGVGLTKNKETIWLSLCYK